MRQAFDRHRKYMYDQLYAMFAVTCFEPTGALYTFPEVSVNFGQKYEGNLIEEAQNRMKRFITKID